MGDVILVAPLFSYLKERYPEAELFFVTNSLYQDFFKDDPRLNTVISYTRQREKLIFSELSEQRWDIHIDLQNNRRSKNIRKKYFGGVKQVTFNKLHIKRFILLYFRVNFYDRQSSVVERYIKAFDRIAGSDIELPSVKLTFKNDKSGRAFIEDEIGSEKKPILALFPFSSWGNKQWHLSSFAEVGKSFSGRGWNIVILGGPEDREGGKKLEGSIGDNCRSFAGDISLYDAGGILKSCKLALGNDTGLSHLARACGVKTGIIYGSTTWHFGFFPYGDPPYKVFQAPVFCRPCHPHGGNFCWRFSRPCLTNIQVDCVIEGMEELYTRAV